MLPMDVINLWAKHLPGNVFAYVLMSTRKYLPLFSSHFSWTMLVNKEFPSASTRTLIMGNIPVPDHPYLYYVALWERTGCLTALNVVYYADYIECKVTSLMPIRLVRTEWSVVSLGVDGRFYAEGYQRTRFKGDGINISDLTEPTFFSVRSNEACCVVNGVFYTLMRDKHTYYWRELWTGVCAAWHDMGLIGALEDTILLLCEKEGKYSCIIGGMDTTASDLEVLLNLKGDMTLFGYRVGKLEPFLDPPSINHIFVATMKISASGRIISLSQPRSDLCSAGTHQLLDRVCNWKHRYRLPPKIKRESRQPESCCMQ